MHVSKHCLFLFFKNETKQHLSINRKMLSFINSSLAVIQKFSLLQGYLVACSFPNTWQLHHHCHINKSLFQGSQTQRLYTAGSLSDFLSVHIQSCQAWLQIWDRRLCQGLISFGFHRLESCGFTEEVHL